MSSTTGPGASERAIRLHYDLSNPFYEKWLDPEMLYSCARFADDETLDALPEAQLRKVDLLADWAGLSKGDSLLEIGCGWGGMLRRAVEHHGAKHATGLSLSQAQTDWIRQRPDDRIDVHIESWLEHRPSQVYDAIISVEAMEAFVKPGLTRTERTAVYRTFFDRCHSWLKPSGKLVLQTIAYGNSGPEDLDAFIARDIFPESDLPTLAELADACNRRFEICTLVNDRNHYLLTIRAWLSNLRRQRESVVSLVGEKTVQRYEAYLSLCTYLFASGSCDLYRIALRRIDFPRESGRQPPQKAKAKENAS